MQKFKDHEITPEHLFLNRRSLMKGFGAVGAMSALPAFAQEDELQITDYEDATSYCNYYEFGLGKEDPAKNAHTLTTSPWSVEVEGMFDKTGTFDLDDIVGGLTQETRIYRFRCVEAWSMVVPWNGVRLRDVLERFGVKPEAKYIAFETVFRPEEMPGQNRNILDWPYREGLRMDEAMHDLTLLATGMYDKALPNQNGAPLRLVVPWKYGFKYVKSIVKITATDEQPYTTWNAANSREYGFYANVNPEVSHPRWSQASERVIGAGLLGGRQETLMFNGYADEVASLYTGMDLREFF